MKKFILVCLAVATVIAFGSCNRKDADTTRVAVTVKNSQGVPQQNVRVYAYRDARPTRNTNTNDAIQNSMTDTYGVAEFDINLKNNNISAGNTMLYFSVFYDVNNETYVTSHSGMTVQKGGKDEISITIPVQ